MAVFSVNQATHLYKVANGAKAAKTNEGDIYFTGLGANGDLRTDLIPKDSIISLTVTNTDKMNIKKTPIKLELANAAKDEDGKVVPGEYVVRFVINNYYGPSMYDGAIKHAAVFVGANTTPSAFMTALKKSIDKNLSREIEKPFSVTTDGATITITPIETEWKLGTKGIIVPDVEVLGVWKDFGNGFEEEWLKKSESQPAAVAIEGSGTKKLCDLEYFCLGERGDIYRNVGWPNVVETKGVLDAALDYDVVTVHYAYTGANEAIQKSEKTMVLVTERLSADTIDKTTKGDEIKDQILG